MAGVCMGQADAVGGVVHHDAVTLDSYARQPMEAAILSRAKHLGVLRTSPALDIITLINHPRMGQRGKSHLAEVGVGIMVMGTSPLPYGDHLCRITLASLRVNFYDSISSTESSENFDVKISLYDRQQYILIPSGKRYFTIELLQNTTNLPPERMAITGLVRIPQGSDKVQKLQPGKQLDITELQKLSGMEEALNNLYKNHVQSFS